MTAYLLVSVAIWSVIQLAADNAKSTCEDLQSSLAGQQQEYRFYETRLALLELRLDIGEKEAIEGGKGDTVAEVRRDMAATDKSISERGKEIEATSKTVDTACERSKELAKVPPFVLVVLALLAGLNAVGFTWFSGSRNKAE